MFVQLFFRGQNKLFFFEKGKYFFLLKIYLKHKTHLFEIMILGNWMDSRDLNDVERMIIIFEIKKFIKGFSSRLICDPVLYHLSF